MFVEVKEDKFWEYVGPRDVTLNNDHPDYTIWKMRNGSVVGKTTPGWRDPCGKKSFYLTNTAVERNNIAEGE